MEYKGMTCGVELDGDAAFFSEESEKGSVIEEYQWRRDGRIRRMYSIGVDTPVLFPVALNVFQSFKLL